MGECLEQCLKIHKNEFRNANLTRFAELEIEYTKRAKEFLLDRDRHGTIMNELYETAVMDLRIGRPEGHLNGQILCIVCNSFVQLPRIWGKVNGNAGLVPYHTCTPTFALSDEMIATIDPINGDVREAKSQTEQNKKQIPMIMNRDKIRKLMGRHGVTEPRQLISLGILTQEQLEHMGVKA